MERPLMALSVVSLRCGICSDIGAYRTSSSNQARFTRTRLVSVLAKLKGLAWVAGLRWGDELPDGGSAGAYNCSSWSDLPQRQRLEIPRSGFVSVDGLWLERHHSAGRHASS
jgi:hypothetical protein